MSTRDLPTDIVPRVPAGERVLLASIDGQLSVIELPSRGELVIGRGSEADVVLDHPSISRRHARLSLEKDALLIEDLGSANGTFVGGKAVAPGKPVIFDPGILVEVGTIILTLRGGPAAEPASAAVDMVIVDPLMTELQETVRVAATSDLSVLLLGETGVGKELFARRIHEQSARAKKPLVRVNCAALVESLLEAELFGHERGAFTGATHAREGLLEAASGGTLFLDEIGEMPLTTQAKLLRVLESGEVTRVGAIKPRPVDIRFVAATNRDLRGLAAHGGFREDLFFRLDGISIRIPALRERVSEIVPLAESFIASAAKAAGRAPETLSAEAGERLRAHSWSGNVRELRNVILRSVLFCNEPVLGANHLRFDAPAPAAPAAASSAPPQQRAPSPSPGDAPAGMSGERLERRQRAIDALEKSVWNQTRAAEVLGISRRTLQNWMIDLDIPRPRTGKRS